MAAVIVWFVPAWAQEIQLVQVASGISKPTDIQSPGDGTGRQFLVQQNGIIRILKDGAVLEGPFLDISSKTRADGERGLLGLAFPPGFSGKQRFYVNYTNVEGNTVIAMYRVSANPNVADAGSETILLAVQQPFANHNGGQLRFGPDGNLYVGMGDGGSAGDPMGNGQSLNTLLGKMLRLDVESSPGQLRVPPDNPFVNRDGARAEIWALGLRNPWRFSFDRATGDLWIADVGQDSFEEVDFQQASSHGGENYGWNRMEGNHCYSAGCNQEGLTPPVAEYPHGEGCSISGGFVYRGRSSPGLRGTYVFGDYCSGTIWGLQRQGGNWLRRQLLASHFGITTFGEDEAGEIYVADANSGTIYRIAGSQAPQLISGAVVNAASFVAGASPGSAATAFAAGVLEDPGIVVADRIPLPTSLSGVAVLVNGRAAPLYAVANVNGQEQVNFQVPLEAAGQQTISVAVTRGNLASTMVTVPVVDPQPAVYTREGVEAVVVHNAGYGLVTAANPLVPGEFAFLYAAGLGRVANAPATRTAAPADPPAGATGDVRVSLAGIPCEVPYAGLATNFVGLFQVNFRVPPNAPSGSQDLALSVGVANAPMVKAPVR